MIRIDARILNEEVILRLDTLPKRLREQLTNKMRSVLETAKADLQLGLPGKYLDPKYVNVAVEQTGSLLIGTLEAADKDGTYPMPKTGQTLMRFISKSGEVVFARHVDHPFLKGAPVVERYFRENKPHLIDQLEDAVFETVYNAR